MGISESSLPSHDLDSCFVFGIGRCIIKSGSRTGVHYAASMHMLRRTPQDIPGRLFDISLAFSHLSFLVCLCNHSNTNAGTFHFPVSPSLSSFLFSGPEFSTSLEMSMSPLQSPHY